MTYFSILILLLLLGVGAIAIVHYFRPAHAAATLLAATVSLLILWLPARLQISASPAARPGDIGILPPWSWQMSEEGWWLGLALLLLLSAGALLTWFNRGQVARSRPVLLLSLLLPGSALLAATAGSLATLLASWTLLAVLWLLLLLAASPAGSVAGGRFLLPGASIFLLWLAAITLPAATGTVGLNLSGWPVLTRSLLLLVAVVQLGAFPFQLWRPLSHRFPSLVAPLVHATPAVAGAALLVRLDAATNISLAFALPLTLVALLGLAWSANTAWRHSDDRPRMAALLGVGQAGLLLLAGTWAGPDAILAEARVLLLAGGTLLLAAWAAETHPLERVGPLLALAALAGLPFTAGFTGRAAVYDAWLAGGRGLLVLVTALLHVPFIAAALLLVWDRSPDSIPGQPKLVSAFSLLLPALGLLGFSGLGNASIIAWFAILLPVASALLLVYYLDETDTARQMVRDALSFPFDLRPFLRPLQRVMRALALYLQQAIAILEGERGLLWLFLILLFIWLVRWQI